MGHKLVIVMRGDLGMSKGKVAAQAAHAAVEAVLRRLDHPDLRTWLAQGQPKVVLRVADEEALQQIVSAAASAAVPVVTIADAGRTQLSAGTTTCCAVGPAVSSDIDQITGNLPLL
ncbi:peptidyl-tRNA hydrolase [Rhizocola hellebori]|uniref:peptidyl-tRNA hydrolase n=1 Tax=Rhizocola hellebori TaxID=1392758 RepID=A0A8J3QBT5_9ACTN|nr:peptidyl-tRNA hydrolase Pth2 [Rhizocola hellebori]GIH07740.1 peptidyl-tRNA hydrolase [Rhizocola hellebori]